MLQETNEAYSKLVGVVDRVFGLAKSDRQYYETKWIANHLQYRGKYDNTVTLLPGRSRVYPRDTRVKVEGFVAKMMELMFPASENNFTFQPSPVPDIPKETCSVLCSKCKTRKRCGKQSWRSRRSEPTP